MMEKAVVVTSMVEETVSATLGIDAVAAQSSNLNKRIEFHLARKSFNGFSNSGDFKIETLNPDPGRRRPDFGMHIGKGDSSSDFVENGLDPELSFGITFRRIGAGLENLGNTCFLNSVLQCLTYTEPLAAYLQSGKHQNSCHISGFCALCAIQRHVSRALQASGRSLVPKDLVSNLKCISRNFRNARQEDAHEYMVNLLESMHKCCLPSGVPSESPAAYEKSLVHKIFGGSLRSQVECQQCLYCSNKFDPFLDLSLEILKADSLPTAFRNFTAAELLDGGEKHYQCQHCKQKVKAKKRLTIHKAPHVLTIHLKRFHAYNPGQKVDKKVVFDRSLNLKPFVSGSYEGELRYSLYGVLVHFGHSTHSGHYLCFVRTSSGMWYRLNDNQVCQVSEKTVLEQKAYMLFYVRDRKNDVAVRKENLKPIVNGMVTGMPLKQLSKQREDKDSVRNVPSVINFPAAINLKDTTEITISKDAIKDSVQHISGPTTSCFLSKENSHVGTVLEAKKETHCPKQDALEGVKPSLVASKTAISELETSTMVIDPKSSSSANVSCSCNGSSSNITIGNVRKNSEPANLTSATVCSSEVPSPDARGKAVENLPSMGSDTQVAYKLDMIKSPTKPSSESLKSGSTIQVASGADAPIAQAADRGQLMSNHLVNPSTSSILPTKGSQRVDTDSRSIRKQKKHPKRRFINITHGVKFWKSPLGLRKKMRRKKVKHCALDTEVLIEGQLGISVSSDLGPSTSETSMAHLSDSGKSQRKRPKSDKGKRCKSEKSSDAYMFGSLEGESIKAEENGEFSVALKIESTKGDGPDGVVSLMGKQPLNSEANHQCKRNREIGNSQSGMMRMLSQGLEETTIARWEGIELPTLQIDEIDGAQNHSIGYVGDEWDEEYDRGKRKKLRQNKHDFGGPNPFQEIASKNQFKKTKTEGFRSGNQPFRI